MKCAIALKRAGNPTCNTQCASCKIWYGNGDIMQNDDHAPAEGHDPKEEVKEHATDKFTEKKVERDIPDEPAQGTIRETEVVREQESIVTELEVEDGEAT